MDNTRTTAPLNRKPTAVIVGGGPAGLVAASVLTEVPNLRIVVCDHKPSVGRKFLVAGKGGLNLTHSEELERFVTRYGRDSEQFRKFIANFTPREWVEFVKSWMESETFVGTSGRVFPSELQAAKLLRTWVHHLKEKGVEFKTQWQWTGFNHSEIIQVKFNDPSGAPTVIMADFVVFALGGASWPETGSDANWVSAFREELGIQVRPFKPSNCGFEVSWSQDFLNTAEGKPLKNIAVRFGEKRICGELLVTSYGLEGGAIYQLSHDLRDEIEAKGHAMLGVDLKESWSAAKVQEKLQNNVKSQFSLEKVVEVLKLPAAAEALIRFCLDEIPSTPETWAAKVKAVPIRMERPRPVAEAISSAGGVEWSEVDEELMLKKYRNVYVAGEMLDWEAPTGGYLLQGCVSTAVAAARDIVKKCIAMT